MFKAYKVRAIVAERKFQEISNSVRLIKKIKKTEWIEVEQIVMAQDVSEARGLAGDLGVIPQSIKEVGVSLWNKEVVTRAYKAQFLQALAFNVEAGMSPGRALEMLVEQESNPNLKLQFYPARMALKRGGSFSDAVRHLGIFDESTVSILVSGEHTGAMKQATQSAIDRFLQRTYATKMVAGVLSWSSIDLAMTLSSVLAVQYKFLPEMEKGGITSEDPVRIKKFNDGIELAYILNGGLLLVAVAVALFVAWISFGMIIAKQDSEWRLRAERVIRKIPGVGSFIRHNAFADTFSIVASMLKGSVRLGIAIKVAQAASSYPLIREYWKSATRRIEVGDSVARALSQPALTTSERLVINSHQTSMQLAKVLGDIAQDREEKSQVLAKKISFWFLIISMTYGSLSVLIYVWLLMIQNDQMFGQMSSG